MSQQRRVVIVGGGPGGLSAAMLLSARGFDVSVFEKRATLGGRSGSVRVGDYTFDVGSTMVMMPFVLEEMFALAGRSLKDEISLVPIEPMYALHFGERSLDVYSDTARMADELRRFSPGSEVGLSQFLARERERLEHLYPLLQRSWPTLASLFSPAVVAALPHVGIAHSLHATAADYFSDERLRLAFSFQAAYLGMSPWDCPGGFGMVPYVEHAWGIDHVRGGIHQMCEAFARVARERGAKIHVSSPVARLVVEGDRCVSVELENHVQIPCDDVIINADGAAALGHLLEDDVSLRFNQERLKHLSESCSTYMLFLGLDCPVSLDHHTFFFAQDYRAEMSRVFASQEITDDLSLYVCNPSVTDPSLAPEGHAALYVLALVPNTTASLDWDVEGPAMRERILRTLERRAGLTLSPHIRAERSITPVDWQNDFGISHGAVFGPSHRIGQLLAFRLPNQLPSPHNVYLAGGATSPGSGLPTILESARIATRLICERHGVDFPASRPLPEVPPNARS